MKLPIPQDVLDQLASTDEKLTQIVEGLEQVAGLLQELVDIERSRPPLPEGG